MHKYALTVFLFLKSSFRVESFHSTLPSRACHKTTFSRAIAHNYKKEDPSAFQEKLDKFLDTQFFDPDSILAEENENSSPSDGGTAEQETEGRNKTTNPTLLWFARLVKNDYETAEALFAAGFISFMVILGQELLRYKLYGENYVPFQKGLGGGFGSKFDWY